MNLTSSLARAALITVLAGAAGLSGAQGTAPSAKKDLVQKVLTLQQASIEGMGAALIGQPAQQLLQAAGRALSQLPPEKREEVGKEIQAEIQKFFDANAPMLRERATKLAPSTVGTLLEERFSEEELKTLISWLESPVSRKFAQFGPESGQALATKLADDVRAQIEPKLKTLEQTVRAKMSAAAPAAPGASGPRAPGPKASGPVKK